MLQMITRVWLWLPQSQSACNVMSHVVCARQSPCVFRRECVHVCVKVTRERALTSKRWELTFLPFFIQVILGLGSPVAWHTNDATPPEMPVWSSGDLTKLGKPEKDGAKKAEVN